MRLGVILIDFVLTAFVHSLQENGWAADTQLECHCLMGSPLEDLQGTHEERQEIIAKELKSSAEEKRALILKTSHIGGHNFAGNTIVRLCLPLRARAHVLMPL